jgi:F0F1-type ATP synthase membrane subunit b/b'
MTLSRSEITKDTAQFVTEITASAVGRIATIVTTAVRDVARELGTLATDIYEMREGAERARRDTEPPA